MAAFIVNSEEQSVAKTTRIFWRYRQAHLARDTRFSHALLAALQVTEAQLRALTAA